MAEGAMAGGAAQAGGAAGGRITRVTKGDKGRTMMHTAVANEVIDKVNEHDAIIQALKKAMVSPKSAGSFKWSDGNLVLILNTVKCDAS